MKPENYKKLFERKNSFFVFCVSILAHGHGFRGAAGRGFEDLVFKYEGDTGVMFTKPDDKESLHKYYLGLVLKNDPILDTCYKIAKETNAIIDEAIHLYQKIESISDTVKFQEHIDLLTKTFIYSTVVPYWVLASVTEKEKDIEIVKKCEELRGITKYPQFVSTVIEKYYKFLSEKIKIDTQIFSYLTPTELKNVIEKPETFDLKIVERRGAGCIVSYPKINDSFLIEYDSRIVQAFGADAVIKLDGNLTGNIAYKGIARGTVKIINTLNDVAKMQDGDVLVSINTSPSLMSAISKAGAIVTDEGGIMCHAAIISRELKKPCIIGTKMATKVLKDGDLVEVDAEKGIIRRI